MKRPVASGLILLLFIMTSVAQSEEGTFVMDFEQPPQQGPDPEDFWVTHSTTGSGSGTFTTGSCSPGCGIGPVTLNHDNQVGLTHHFTLEPGYQGQYSNYSYQMSYFGLGNGGGPRWTLLSDGGTLQQMRFHFSGSAGSTDAEVEVNGDDVGPDFQLCAYPIQLNVTLDWVIGQITTTVATIGGGTCGTVTDTFNTTTHTKITGWDITHLVTSTQSHAYNDITLSGIGVIPEPPAGMKAQVIDNQPGDEIVFLQWLSSPNDDGTFNYELYANSTLIATRSAGEDTDGVWAYTHNGDLADSITYHTVAVSGISSNNSCTVNINTTNQGNTDACGDPIPGDEEPGSNLTGPNGALFGGSRSALATALQISETSLGFLIGAFLTMLLTAGLYFYFKVIGGIIGAVIGLTISYSTNLLPAWSLYVLIFTTLAGVILWTRTRPMRGM